jgi:hypothetical protein
MASKTKEVNVKLDHITRRHLQLVFIIGIVAIVAGLTQILLAVFKLQADEHGGNARPRAPTKSKELLQYHDPSATPSFGALYGVVVVSWLCPVCFLICAIYKLHTAALPLDYDLKRYRMLWTCVSQITVSNT